MNAGPYAWAPQAEWDLDDLGTVKLSDDYGTWATLSPAEARALAEGLVSAAEAAEAEGRPA